ncbi:copper amine oxidase N-terminal domain-containing protein [Paenibacillus allorhizosphaerae]|uniref:Copper amine oxidase-like N-terminal domain-containing protein n=1 Tax=Paenibacillus allorhizosphaerae TaxID=2849866 RepID=A0ABM8VD24_9BACL|nr:copper amine oxidase N-terminal domain-containing protein [Paenibacillus allorhizosphaerae]CAG7624983.1 hypothetical protein PAECIP111802_01119 [Paenibacillus allorhizosphaerae]
MPNLRKVCIPAIILCAALLPLSAFADEAPAGKTVNVQLKLGEDKIIINEQAVVVEKPYITNGATLVPLRVITSAFGAALSWDSETQTVGLKSGTTTISLQIGSTTATVNGKTEQLEAAAELANGTTMVPLRFIAEKFGAKVTFDEKTSSVNISGTQSASSSDNAGIDSDVGKTQIGNSFHGWSMKYPSGLIKDYQSFTEDYVSFEDANGEFTLDISVDSDMAENLSQDALINLLADQVEETILEKTYVTEGGRSYARILTKGGGEMYEYRAYQNGDKVYYLYFTITKAENYKNPVKYSAYKDLMDSFKTSFPASDKSLKDLSMVKDGQRTYTDETYGFTLKLPADWKKGSTKGETITFTDAKGVNSVGFRITSKKDGDSVQTWAERNNKIFTDLWVPEYRKVEPERTLTIDGTQALARRTHNTFDLKSWDATENVYIIKGDYKYFMYFQFEKQDTLSESFIQSTLESVKIGKSSASIGTIKDLGESYDRTLKSVVKNKTYNYSINIPTYWKAESSKASSDLLKYTYEFGAFLVGVKESDTLSPSDLVATMKQGMQADSKSIQIKEVENRTETIAGAKAQWVVWDVQEYVSTVCAFQKNGMTFFVYASHPKAVNTEFMKNLIGDTIKSIQVTN